MPYAATRRFYNEFGKKVSKMQICKRAKRLFNEINRGMLLLEEKYLKSRLHHA